MVDSDDSRNGTHSAGEDLGFRSSPASRRIPQIIRKRAPLLGAITALTLLFVVAAVLQHWFVHSQSRSTSSKELRTWAEEIKEEVAPKGKWALKGYRQTSFSAPNDFVVAHDGLIIDIGNFIPGVLGRVAPPAGFKFGEPQTITPSTGEAWRLFGKELEGGYVILGIPQRGDILDEDAILIANAQRFGTTLKEAESVKPRRIDQLVDYVVVNANGELRQGLGGVPLVTDMKALPNAPDHVVRKEVGDKPYLLYSDPISSDDGATLGTIIVAKDVSVDEQALESLDKFNLWVIGVCLVAGATTVIWFMRGLLTRRKALTLKEALKLGEGQTIEFKSTFHWDVEQHLYIEDRRFDVLRAIGAFLNSGGGQLFIGVTDDGTVRGIKEDLEYVKGSKDQLQRSFRDLITHNVGPEYAPLIKDSLHEMNGAIYWMIDVDEAPEAVYVRQKKILRFFVRDGNKTSELVGASIHRYIKNKETRE